MANYRVGKQQGGDDLVYEKIVPSSAWTEDSSSHYLLVDLPGFKKEQLKLQIDGHSHILVSGEMQTNSNKIIHFKESAKVPENSDMEKISGKYEGEVLYVIVPKRVQDKAEEIKQQTLVANIVEENPKDEKENYDKDKGDFVEKRDVRKREFEEKKNDRLEGLGQSGILENALEILSKNKGIIVTALLAFSLGVLLSQKFQSDSVSEGSHSYDQIV